MAKLADVDLPVEPLRRMLVPSEPFDEFPHTAPMIVDMSNGFHFRPEARGSSRRPTGCRLWSSLTASACLCCPAAGTATGAGIACALSLSAVCAA